MGGFWSSSKPKPERKRIKRKLTNEPDLETPTEKRVRSTYEYVYRELFCRGQGSDLTVRSLGYEWNLHRLYVKQSPFFAAMLEGGWKESDCSNIELELSDANITKDSLDAVFGSFYRDSILISGKNVVNVLAAATWFHMEDIRNLCSSFMLKRLRLPNVIDCFQISKQYNLPELDKGSVEWLADRILLIDDSEESCNFLRQVPIELMCEVIKKPNMVVVQLEQDVFLLLLKWVYVQFHPEYEFTSTSELLRDAYSFFTSSPCSFLETPTGDPYVPVFKALRWEHILNIYKTTQRMVQDRVVPEGWLCNIFSRQWLRLLHSYDNQINTTRSNLSGSGDEMVRRLRVRNTVTSWNSLESVIEDEPSTVEPGPQANLSEELFWAKSERCGRIINNGDATFSWRWTGYHFGLDIVVKYRRRTFSIIRFTEPTAAEGAICHVGRHRLLIAMRVISMPAISHELTNTITSDPDNPETPIDVVNQETQFTDLSKPSNCVSTAGVLSLSLEENSLQDILHLPSEFKFPALVSANLLRFDPIDLPPEFIHSS